MYFCTLHMYFVVSLVFTSCRKRFQLDLKNVLTTYLKYFQNQVVHCVLFLLPREVAFWITCARIFGRQILIRFELPVRNFRSLHFCVHPPDSPMVFETKSVSLSRCCPSLPRPPTAGTSMWTKPKLLPLLLHLLMLKVFNACGAAAAAAGLATAV